jgi:hypothetical protein
MPSDRGTTRRWLRDIEYHIDLAESFVAGVSYAPRESGPA